MACQRAFRSWKVRFCWLALPASEIRADLDLTRDVENLDLGIEVVTRTKRRVLLVHHNLGCFFQILNLNFRIDGGRGSDNQPTYQYSYIISIRFYDEKSLSNHLQYHDI